MHGGGVGPDRPICRLVGLVLAPEGLRLSVCLLLLRVYVFLLCCFDPSLLKMASLSNIQHPASISYVRLTIRQEDTGFRVWSSIGRPCLPLIHNYPRFYQVLWRPRPPSLLKAEHFEVLCSHASFSLD
jgi:hypothetical protein